MVEDFKFSVHFFDFKPTFQPRPNATVIPLVFLNCETIAPELFKSAQFIDIRARYVKLFFSTKFKVIIIDK